MTRVSSPQPKPPENLHPLSRELLESLVGHSQAAEIVIGGGVALSHYLEYRTTVDLDAWWRAEPRADVLSFLETIANEDAREQAARVRDWYHRVFAAP